MDEKLESACLEKLSEGSHQAFEILYLHYHPKLVRFLAGFLKDEEEAFDMAQELFFKVWTLRREVAGIRSFQAYLFSMARNALASHYEHTLVKARYEEHLRQSPEGYDTTDDLLARDLSEQLDRLVDDMPTQRRKVFRLSRREGLSNEEIASRLHISKRTVENHLSTVLGVLRRALGRFSCFLLS